MKKLFIIMIFLSCIVVFSENLKITGSFDISKNSPEDDLNFNLILEQNKITFLGEMGFARKDNITIPYNPNSFGNLFGHFWYIKNSCISTKLSDNLGISLGIMSHEEGPGINKLFLDDNSIIGFPSFVLKNDFERFTFKDIWVSIKLPGYGRTKSLNYRSLILNFGNLKIAFEDSVVYLDRIFDPYYFFTPLPVPVIQEMWHFLNAPWRSSVDDNSFIGGWFDYRFTRGRVYGEILVDDINLNRFLAPESDYQNPDKIAILLGGSINTAYGKVYGEISGATAYTFERTKEDVPYEYTYFDEGDIEDRMIGYKYGENSLAITVGFQKSIQKHNMSIEYSYLVHGTRTPSSPWHGEEEMPSGTKWLVGDLESIHDISFYLSTSADWFEATFKLSLNSSEGFKMGVSFSYEMDDTDFDHLFSMFNRRTSGL